MRNLVTTLILAGLPLMALSSTAQITQTEESRSPVDILLTAQVLDDAAVGYAGQRTARYDAFSKLYTAGKTSGDAARKLVLTATPQGRIYGLLILRHVAPEAVDGFTERMLQDRDQVTMMNGCIVSHSTVAELVAQIRKGKEVIILPKEAQILSF